MDKHKFSGDINIVPNTYNKQWNSAWSARLTNLLLNKCTDCFGTLIHSSGTATGAREDLRFSIIALDLVYRDVSRPSRCANAKLNCLISSLRSFIFCFSMFKSFISPPFSAWRSSTSCWAIERLWTRDAFSSLNRWHSLSRAVHRSFTALSSGLLLLVSDTKLWDLSLKSPSWKDRPWTNKN